jgi:hypothetical protein
MKIRTTFITIVPAVVIAALAVSSCREALYPVARAFGSPPESELAVCRVAFRQLQMHLETSRVQVEPVLFAVDHGRQWRNDVAQAIVVEAGAHTKAKLEAATAPDVSFPSKMYHNQLRYLWDRSREYARWIKVAPPGADYVLCAEVFGHEGKVDAIQVYVFDAKGQIAYCRLFNSHHFGKNLPLEGEGHVRLMVKVLFDDLRKDANVIFPPYGVG